MLESVNDVMVVWELRGSYPEIPTFPDVDIAALTEGDENPVYITLPIGEAGATSRNKRHYDEAFVMELARQTQLRKPAGIMGHVKGKPMEWPEDDVHWVGMKFENGQLWGKAYVSSKEGRERVRLYKSTNKPIATSIYAHMGLNWDEKIGAYRADSKSLDLHRIDLGPIDMAGIQSMAKIPHVTAELIDENDDNKENEMDKLQVIREMTAEDAALLPQPVRDVIVATVQTPAEVGLVTELRAELGDGDLLQAVRELKEEREERQKTAVTHRVTELVNEGIKAESLRPLVVELVQAKAPDTLEAAETAYKTVVEGETVMELLKAHVTQAGGPPLRMGVQGGKGGNKYIHIPEKENK